MSRSPVRRLAVIASIRRSCCPCPNDSFASPQLGIAFDAAVIPQDAFDVEAIEARDLAGADLQCERVLARGIDNWRAPVRLSPATQDFLLVAKHPEHTAMTARAMRSGKRHYVGRGRSGFRVGFSVAPGVQS